MFNGFHGNADGVANGFHAGTAVSDHADPVHAQKERASIFLVTSFFLNGLEGGAGQPGSGHAKRGFLDFVFEPVEDGGRDAFTGFENHIADKSVTDDDFHGVFEEVATLDVSDKVYGRCGKEFESLLG